MIFNLALTIFSRILDEDTEGSGDVCNVEGSTCPDPDNTCCRDEQCQKEGGHSKCCSDPSSENNCSPCSVCGKSILDFLSNEHFIKNTKY